MALESNVYIGRKGIVFVDGQRFPPHNSPFANPFKVGKDGTREEVLEKFRAYMKARLQAEPDLKQQLQQLKGKQLGCWCHPERCHGDILLELIEDQ